MHADGLSEPAETTLHVMVVDDHDLFRTGLRRLLEEQEGLEIVADARRGAEAVERAAELRPDVVVMDVNMPGMSGVEATRALREVSPASAVLMLTVTHDKDAVLDAVLAGASGYLLKDASLPEIVRGIRAAAAGESLIAPAVAGNLLTRLRHHGAPEVRPAPGPDLSPRELEVLRLVAAGLPDREIADTLLLSRRTVNAHVAHILAKLDVSTRRQAVVRGHKLRHLTGDDAPSLVADGKST